MHISKKQHDGQTTPSKISTRPLKLHHLTTKMSKEIEGSSNHGIRLLKASLPYRVQRITASTRKYTVSPTRSCKANSKIINKIHNRPYILKVSHRLFQYHISPSGETPIICKRNRSMKNTGIKDTSYRLHLQAPSIKIPKPPTQNKFT